MYDGPRTRQGRATLSKYSPEEYGYSTDTLDERRDHRSLRVPSSSAW
jgi:hypothetical protein